MKMKKLQLFLAAMLLVVGASFAQVVTVTNPSNVGPTALSATYASLAAAITDLNTKTSITGPVTITLNSGNPQTNPAGGYSISATLSGASNTNRVTIAGSGNTITAPNPAGTAGALNDAIFKVIGSDFITISGFVMNENSLNTTTTAASNNMVEWGVAVLYGSTTNGCQNIIIENNTITLNRTYQNTFGIYSNSTHSATTIATSATATTTAGANNDLKIYGNTISNVNNGILYVGPTAAADHNTGLDIGGSGGSQANTISNFGTTGTFSGYANVSGTVYGIYVRNSKGYNISYNSITSSNGGVTTATLRGIYSQSATNAPTGTFTNNINYNTISLTIGSATGTLQGIGIEATNASSTAIQNINNNNFTALTGSIATSAGITAISTVAPFLTLNINNNTFTNISTNTTGSFTFLGHSYTMPATGSQTINNNSIVTAFNKTGAGGTVTISSTASSSPNGSSHSFTNNNFSNMTVTGATAITGVTNTDGSASSPSKTCTGNTFSNWTGGTGSITGISYGYIGATTSSISNNTLSNITGQGSITGITIGSTFNGATTLNVANNTISNLTSTGTGGAVTGITCSNTSTTINFNNNTVSTLATTAGAAVQGIVVSGATVNNIYKNTICNLSGSNASSTVNGITLSASSTGTISNNRIGDLRATVANAANPINGINISGGTNVNVYFNTVYLNASSTGALFGSSALNASSTPTLTMNNNVLVNNSTTAGAGLAVAYRRSSSTLTSYASTSDRNDFFASTIYTDGTTPQATIAAYKTLVATRDANSISVNPTFLSTTCGDANFLKVSTSVASQLESTAANISGITDDFENEIRQGNAGYATQVNGGGTAPDMGADEFDGIPAPVCSGTPASATVNGASSVCINAGTTLSLSTTYTDLGITYQWASSTASGGPYTTILGTGISQATGNLSVPTYFVCTITCTNSGLSYTTAEKAVAINALPGVTVTPSSASICQPGGTAVSLTAGGATSYIWANATGLSATTGSSVTANPANTTTYTVTGTDANGCSATSTTVITIAPSVTAIASASPTNVCNGSNSQLDVVAGQSFTTPAPSAYAFAGSTGSYSTITGTTLGASAIGDDVGIGNLPIGFTFNYNGTNHTVFGARSNGLIELSQTGATLSGFSANALATNPNCIAPLWDDNNTTGGSIIYSTTGTAPTRVLTVQWTGMHVGGSGSSSNTTINMQARLYESTNKIEFIYGTTSGAFTSTSASIGISGSTGNYLSVTPLSPANTSTTSSSTENASISASTNFPSGTIYSFTPSGAPTLTYAWTESPSTTLSSTSIANPMSNGITATNNYTVTVSGSGGCTATSTLTVNVASSIVCSPITSSNGTSLCIGQNTTLTASATIGGTPYSYVWTADPSLSATNIANPLATPTATTTYTCTVTDACGTTCSTTITINVNSLPTVGVSPSSSNICNPGGTAVSLTASGTATGYSWLPATGLSGTTGSSVTALPSATTTYTVTGTDANGCSATSTTSVSINLYPVLTSISATPATVCSNGASDLLVVPQTATSAAGMIYTASTGASLETMTSSTVVTAITTGTLDDGFMTVTPSGFTFPYLGTNVTTFNVGTNGYVILGATTPSSTIPSSLTTHAGFNGIYAFGRDGNLNTTNSGNLTHGPAAGGKYVFEMNKYSGGSSGAESSSIYATYQIVLWGTTSADPGKIEVIYGTSAGTPATSGTIGIRDAANTFINGINGSTSSTTTSSTWPTSGQKYTYSLPAAPSLSWSPATFLNSTTIANPQATSITASTTYTVTASSNGCSTTSSVTVALAGAIVCSPITSSNGSTLCVGQNTTLTASATIGGTPYTYVWTADASLSATNVANPVATPTTTTTYTCTVTDACGTTCSTTITINVNPTPTATASSNGPVCTGTTLNLTGTSDIGTTFSWTGPNSYTSTAQNPSITNVSALEAGTYTLTATDNGCTSTPSTVTVVVNQTPSAVTITPSTASITCGSSQTLGATGGEILTSSILGTGTSSSTATSTGSALGPNPFQSYYGGTKQQMLILASELTSMGLVNGSAINSIAFNLSAAESRTLLDYQVKMKLTSQASFSSTTFATGMTTVKTPASYTPATGWNTIPLTSNFVWDGTNNLIIEVNFSNNDGGGSGTNTARLSTTAFASSLFYRTDNATSATVDAQATASFAAYSSRNNITLGFSQPSSFAWSPSTTLNTAVGVNVIASPSATTTYTVTATSNGCSVTNTSTVTVNPNPDIALSTAGNAASVVGSSCLTQTLANNDMIIYLNSSCNRILNIADEPGGSGLGSTSACVNVSATNPVGSNGQVYAPRYFEIIPTVSEGAAMVAYFTQADFDAYNAGNGSLLDFPVNGSDPNSANVLVAQVAGGTLATGTISSITPVFVSWNATDLRWQVVFNATALGGYYYLYSNPSCNYTMPAATVSNITSSSAQFDWTSAGAGLTYDWRYRVQGATSWTNAGTGTSAVTRVFTGLASNTTYEFQGKVRCGAGLSGLYGSTVTFTTAMGPCTTPTGLAYSGLTSNSVTLSWTAMSSPVTSYVLRYRIVGSGTWMNAGVTTNTKTISGLTPGSNYEAQIASYCSAAGTLTAYSSSVTFTTTIACPVTTNLAYSNATSNSVQLTWDAMGAPVTSYVVSYRIVGSGTWLNAGASTNSKTLSGLTSGADYEAIVKSYCAASGTLTAASNTVTFTTAAGCPVTSSISSNSVTTSQANLSWTDVSTATSGNKYVLRYRINPSGSWINAGCPTYLKTIYGLSANTTYDVQVQTVCAGGILSAFSDSYTFSTPASKPEEVIEATTETATTFAIYPNPTSNVINIDFYASDNQTTMVKVYDLTGRLMKQVTRQSAKGNNSMDINLIEFANGLYTIQVFENDTLTHTSRVRKNN